MRLAAAVVCLSLIAGPMFAENDCGTMAPLQESRDCASEAVPKIRIASRDQGDLPVQSRFKEGPRVSRTVRYVAGDRGPSRAG